MLSLGSRSWHAVARAGGTAVILAALIVLAGCSTIRSMMPSAHEAKQLQEKQRQLQAKCMRFADQYVGRVVEESARFERAAANLELRTVLSGWRLSQANSAYSIAAGESAIVNALDLVTLAVLSRMVVEDTIVPRFADDAAPLLAVHRQLEESAWKLTEDFLTASQAEDFRNVLAQWRAKNPRVASVAFVHFVDFARAVGRPAPGEAESSGNLFGLIGLDPLAGLDPAIKQIEQTRLLAERAIYYMQRVPYVLNLQVDRVTSDLLMEPEVRGALADADRVSRSAERFAGVAEGLPDAFARERAALINQLSDVLGTQEATMQPMLVELRQALEAADATAGSVNSVVKSIDALMARRPPPPAGAPSAEAGRPFDIVEYTRAAEQFTRTASELRLLLTALDGTAPALASTLGDTVARGRSLVNHFALIAAALIVLAIGGTLAAALAYRSLAHRMKS
jgi:hypothetical protein